MGIIRCQHHGTQPILLVCEHVREAVLRRSVMGEVFRVEAYYLDVLAGLHYICPVCAAHEGIAQNPTIWRDEQSIDRMAAMKCNIVPVCSKCFDEAATRPVA